MSSESANDNHSSDRPDGNEPVQPNGGLVARNCLERPQEVVVEVLAILTDSSVMMV